MQQSDKKVDYNTKISEEDFELLQKQREARNQNQLNMIQSKYIRNVMNIPNYMRDKSGYTNNNLDGLQLN